MAAIDEIKSALLSDEIDTKLFSTYLKAIEELSTKNEEFKERLKQIDAVKINFNLPDANMTTHLEITEAPPVSAGSGLVDSPDITVSATEKGVKDIMVEKSGFIKKLVSDMMTDDIKITAELLGTVDITSIGELKTTIRDRIGMLDIITILERADAILSGVELEIPEKGGVAYMLKVAKEEIDLPVKDMMAKLASQSGLPIPEEIPDEMIEMAAEFLGLSSEDVKDLLG